MKILLQVRYIGTAYCGFQYQKNGRSIQAVLTEAACRVFGRPCLVTGCSRTDAGVHALGYCCTVAPAAPCETWCSIPVERIHRAFAPQLPADISVRAAAVVDDSFHPRYDTVGKEYIYRIWDHPWEDPFLKGRSCRCIFPVTPERQAVMEEAAALLCGKHDFRGFMSGGSSVTDTVRTVRRTALYRDGDGSLVFSVEADGFLYNMVRIMAGTLLDAAAGRIALEQIEQALQTGERRLAGFTAPPEGLYLNRVFYPAEPDWRCR